MSRTLGAKAEALAAALLERSGYRIVARNFTVKGGELDLVALHGDKKANETLCFVEVRARADGSADESVGPVKQRRLVTAARAFLAKWRDPEAPCRFDVVAVDPTGMRIIKNAFDAE